MNVVDLLSLKGKIVVVTGGAGLYGSYIVEGLCEAGATVYVASRDAKKNREKLSYLLDKGYDLRFGKDFDLTDEKSIVEMCDGIYNEAGRVDVLINNAVLRCTSGYSDSAENFTRSLIANGTGLFLISRAFGEKMRLAGKGSIINIGSYMGILGPDYSLYEGTDMNKDGAVPDYFFHKGGMTNYTRYLATHLGRYGIRCNCVELGGLIGGQPQLFIDNYNKKTPLGRMAEGDDVKGIIVYLSSDASAYMNGAIIPLDGGYSAK